MSGANSFSGRLKLARKRRGLNQSQLGDLMSLTKQAVAAWEQGRNQPNAGQLVELCKHLKVDANFLVLGVQTVLSAEAVGFAAAFDSASDETKHILRKIFSEPVDDSKVSRAFGSPPTIEPPRSRPK